MRLMFCLCRTGNKPWLFLSRWGMLAVNLCSNDDAATQPCTQQPADWWTSWRASPKTGYGASIPRAYSTQQCIGVQALFFCYYAEIFITLSRISEKTQTQFGTHPARKNIYNRNLFRSLLTNWIESVYTYIFINVYGVYKQRFVITYWQCSFG